MPVVLVPFVAIGVALLALLVAYALAVLFTPLLEGIARNVPVVGGYVARGIGGALDYAARKITSWANEGVDLVAGWLHGLAESVREFVDAVNRYLVDLPDLLAHLKADVTPALLHTVVAPVRALALDAKRTADALAADLSDVFTKPLRDFKGIEHGVELRVDALHNIVRNVDLPNVLGAAETQAGRLFDVVEGDLHGLRDYSEHEFARVWDQLGKLPLEKLLQGLAAAGAAAALVNLIASEAGLDSAECRGKVKNICATDPAGWAQLLETLALGAIAWGGLEELIGELQAVVADVGGAVIDLVRS